MKESQPTDAFEAALGAALRESSGGCPPGCPSPETLIDLIEQGGSHPESEQLLLHIAECSDCLRDYDELRATLDSAAQATNTRATQRAAEPSSNTSGFWHRILRNPVPAFGAALGAILLAVIGFQAIVRQPQNGAGRTDPEYVQTALRELDVSFQVSPPRWESERGEEAIQSLAPVSVCTESSRPQLEWHDDETGEYSVTIYQGEHKLTEGSGIKDLKWTPAIELPSGQTLTWSVVDMKRPDRASQLVKFRVLTTAEKNRLADDLKRVDGRPLSRAVVLAAYGLRDQALEELDRVNPSDRRVGSLKASIVAKMPVGLR